MTEKQLKKRLNLSQKDFQDISDTIEKMERKTSGEIAIAVAPQSSSYAFWEAASSAGTVCALFLCVFPMSPQIYRWLEGRFWNIQPYHLSLFFFLLCSAAGVLLYFFYNIPAVDSIVIPRAAKECAVSSRAVRYFSESGIYCTENHSGILIFVSYFEKQVRILADRGISEKISSDLWNIISDELSENLCKGNAKEAFVQAIEKCGQLLQDNFPVQAEKKNELYNGLVVLEDEKWM